MIKERIKSFIKQKNITHIMTKDELISLKNRFEELINNFPVYPIEIYLEIYSQIIEEKEKRDDVIDAIVDEKNKESQKSQEAALVLMKHKAFRVDNNPHIVRIVSNNVLLPGNFQLQSYEENLSRFIYEGKTYWEIFKESIFYASPVYNPYDKRPFYFDENKHCYLNIYIPPSWKNIKCLPYEALSPILRSFLEHLFVNKQNLFHVLKWCAHSRISNLQTYLTLIGQPGIGKTLFVNHFLAYYHGYDNFNITTRIEDLNSTKNHNSTLIYLDEMVMNKLDNYNTLKRFTNDLVGSDKRLKTDTGLHNRNYANIIWSSNTKDGMGALCGNDRRFKIVPITEKPLNEEIGVYDEEGKRVLDFNIENITQFKNNIHLKDEFVSHMFYILAHTTSTDDINAVDENKEKSDIILASANPEFREILDVFFKIVNDFDLKERRKIYPEDYNEKMQENGIPYLDFMPISGLVPCIDKRYNVRIPYKSIVKVMNNKKIHAKFGISERKFAEWALKMPPTVCKLKHLKNGGTWDIEIDVPFFPKEFSDIVKQFYFRFDI